MSGIGEGEEREKIEGNKEKLERKKKFRRIKISVRIWVYLIYRLIKDIYINLLFWGF